MDMVVRTWIAPETGMPIVVWKQRRAYYNDSKRRSTVYEDLGIGFYGYDLELEQHSAFLVDLSMGKGPPQIKLRRPMIPREIPQGSNAKSMNWDINKVRGFRIPQEYPDFAEKVDVGSFFTRMEYTPRQELVEIDYDGEAMYFAAHVGKNHGLRGLQATLQRAFITSRPRGGWRHAPFDEEKHYPLTNQEAIDLMEGRSRTAAADDDPI